MARRRRRSSTPDWYVIGHPSGQVIIKNRNDGREVAVSQETWAATSQALGSTNTNFDNVVRISNDKAKEITLQQTPDNGFTGTQVLPGGQQVKVLFKDGNEIVMPVSEWESLRNKVHPSKLTYDSPELKPAIGAYEYEQNRIAKDEATQQQALEQAKARAQQGFEVDPAFSQNPEVQDIIKQRQAEVDEYNKQQLEAQEVKTDPSQVKQELTVEKEPDVYDLIDQYRRYLPDEKRKQLVKASYDENVTTDQLKQLAVDLATPMMGQEQAETEKARLAQEEAEKRIAEQEAQQRAEQEAIIAQREKWAAENASTEERQRIESEQNRGKSPLPGALTPETKSDRTLAREFYTSNVQPLINQLTEDQKNDWEDKFINTEGIGSISSLQSAMYEITDQIEQNKIEEEQRLKEEQNKKYYENFTKADSIFNQSGYEDPQKMFDLVKNTLEQNKGFFDQVAPRDENAISGLTNTKVILDKLETLKDKDESVQQRDMLWLIDEMHKTIVAYGGEGFNNLPEGVFNSSDSPQAKRDIDEFINRGDIPQELKTYLKENPDLYKDIPPGYFADQDNQKKFKYYAMSQYDTEMSNQGKEATFTNDILQNAIKKGADKDDLNYASTMMVNLLADGKENSLDKLASQEYMSLSKNPYATGERVGTGQQNSVAKSIAGSFSELGIGPNKRNEIHNHLYTVNNPDTWDEKLAKQATMAMIAVGLATSANAIAASAVAGSAAGGSSTGTSILGTPSLATQVQAVAPALGTLGSKAVAGGITSGVVSAGTQAVFNQGDINWSDVGKDALKGAAGSYTGGLTGKHISDLFPGIGSVGADAVSGATSGVVSNLADQIYQGASIDLDEVGKAGLAGGVTGAIPEVVTDPLIKAGVNETLSQALSNALGTASTQGITTGEIDPKQIGVNFVADIARPTLTEGIESIVPDDLAYNDIAPATVAAIETAAKQQALTGEVDVEGIAKDFGKEAADDVLKLVGDGISNIVPKLPSVDLPDGPGIDINAEIPDYLKLDGLDLNAPDLPEIDPSLNLKMNLQPIPIDVNFNTNLGVFPEYDVNIPKANVDIPKISVDDPKLNVDAPKISGSTPDLTGMDLSTNLDLGVKTPDSDIDFDKPDLKLDNGAPDMADDFDILKKITDVGKDALSSDWMGPVLGALVGGLFAREGAQAQVEGMERAAQLNAEQAAAARELQNEFLNRSLDEQAKAREQSLAALTQGTQQAAESLAIPEGQTDPYSAIGQQVAQAQTTGTQAALGELTPGYQQARADVATGYEGAMEGLTEAQKAALQSQATGFQQGQQALGAGILQQQGILGQALEGALGFGAGQREAGQQGLSYLQSALTDENPLLALRAKQEEEDINRALAARGLFNSGAAVEALSEASQRRSAEEAARRVGIANQLASLGLPANQIAAQLTAGTGSQAAGAVGQGQAGIADLAAQQGQSLAQTNLQGADRMAGLQTQQGANLGNLATQEAGQRSALQAALGSGLAQTAGQFGTQSAGRDEERRRMLANLYQQAGQSQANVAQGYGSSTAGLLSGVGQQQAQGLSNLGNALGQYAAQQGQAEGSFLAGLGAGASQLGQGIYQGSLMKDIYGQNAASNKNAPAAQNQFAMTNMFAQPTQQKKDPNQYLSLSSMFNP